MRILGTAVHHRLRGFLSHSCLGTKGRGMGLKLLWVHFQTQARHSMSKNVFVFLCKLAEIWARIFAIFANFGHFSDFRGWFRKVTDPGRENCLLVFVRDLLSYIIFPESFQSFSNYGPFSLLEATKTDLDNQNYFRICKFRLLYYK